MSEMTGVTGTVLEKEPRAEGIDLSSDVDERFASSKGVWWHYHERPIP